MYEVEQICIDNYAFNLRKIKTKIQKKITIRYISNCTLMLIHRKELFYILFHLCLALFDVLLETITSSARYPFS